MAVLTLTIEWVVPSNDHGVHSNGVVIHSDAESHPLATESDDAFLTLRERCTSLTKWLTIRLTIWLRVDALQETLTEIKLKLT